MAARYVEQFTVRTPDELEELEQVISDGLLDAVVVDVPDGAVAFQSAREFRHLLNVARAAGVDIQLSTDDPLRRELARIIGFRLTSDTVLDRPVPDTPPTSQTFRIVRPEHPETVDVTASDAEEDGWRNAETRPSFQPFTTPVDGVDEDDEDDEVDDGSYSFVIHPPTVRRSTTQQFDRPARQADTIPTFEVWESSSYDTAYRQPATSRLRAMGPIALGSLALTVFLIGALLTMFVLPSATIAVSPVESQVNASLTYGVALPGTNWDISVPPETISTTLTFSATIPTTGERFEPDAAARGVILLTNASTVETLIPVGTVVTSQAGVEYATTTDVVVPAADPYGSLTIGSASVEVAAVAAGPDSNAEAETVFGQLDNGIYYLNRDPITGGTTKRIATVSQADIDTLTQRARADLDAKAAGAIETTLQDGQRLIDGSEQRGQMQATFSHAVGADAESLKLDAALTVSAQAYNLDDVHEQARSAVAERLRIQAGNQVTVLDETLKTTAPKEVPGSNGTAFSVDATATTRANIDEATLDSLRHELSGDDADAALARIQQVPGVGSVNIDQSPGWLGGKLPRLESRIQIEVVNATPLQAQTTSSGP